MKPYCKVLPFLLTLVSIDPIASWYDLTTQKPDGSGFVPLEGHKNFWLPLCMAVGITRSRVMVPWHAVCLFSLRRLSRTQSSHRGTGKGYSWSCMTIMLSLLPVFLCLPQLCSRLGRDHTEGESWAGGGGGVVLLPVDRTRKSNLGSISAQCA